MGPRAQTNFLVFVKIKVEAANQPVDVQGEFLRDWNSLAERGGRTVSRPEDSEGPGKTKRTEGRTLVHAL